MTDEQIKQLAETILSDPKLQSKVVGAMCKQMADKIERESIGQIKHGLIKALENNLKAKQEYISKDLEKWTDKYFSEEMYARLEKFDKHFKDILLRKASQYVKQRAEQFMRDKFKNIKLSFSIDDLFAEEKSTAQYDSSEFFE